MDRTSLPFGRVAGADSCGDGMTRGEQMGFAAAVVGCSDAVHYGPAKPPPSVERMPQAGAVRNDYAEAAGCRQIAGTRIENGTGFFPGVVWVSGTAVAEARLAGAVWAVLAASSVQSETAAVWPMLPACSVQSQIFFV